MKDLLAIAMMVEPLNMQLPLIIAIGLLFLILGLQLGALMELFLQIGKIQLVERGRGVEARQVGLKFQ